MCPAGHPLVKFQTPIAGYTCDGCDTMVPAGEWMHGCVQCDYDKCAACFAGGPPAGEPAALAGPPDAGPAEEDDSTSASCSDSGGVCDGAPTADAQRPGASVVSKLRGRDSAAVDPAEAAMDGNAADTAESCVHHIDDDTLTTVAEGLCDGDTLCTEDTVDALGADDGGFGDVE